MSKAHFFIEGRLANLLGENYSTCELALKELIDNAWDADADNVWITLPEDGLNENCTIIIKDDGLGMTGDSIRKEYLHIARDRVKSKGLYTVGKKRKVKGKKGIGKFAGLTLAGKMSLNTKSNGKCAELIIDKNKLIDVDINLNELEINIETCKAEPFEHGTTIYLSEFNPSFIMPGLEKLKKILLLEYGREQNFNIYINDKILGIENIGGEHFQFKYSLGENKDIILNFNITEKRLKKNDSGIVLRVSNKIIGEPQFWGIEEDESIPIKLLHKVYGEVEANFLLEFTTNSWGILENTRDYQELKAFICDKVTSQLYKKFKQEIRLQTKNIEKKLELQLSRLPENRRKYASQRIKNVLKNFYGESEAKIDIIINVMIEALEKDIYFDIIDNINIASEQDVHAFAEALNEFGLADVGIIAQQAKNRLKFLDYLQKLVNKQDTLEKDIHKAIEQNMWIFGYDYNMMASNVTTASIIDKFCNKHFTGDRANKRPDLLLNKGYKNAYLLIEFKRPSIKIERVHERQALEYRDDLKEFMCNAVIDIIVLGGTVNSSIIDDTQNLKLMSFDELIAEARTQLEWLIDELKRV